MHIKKISLNNREIEYFETGSGKETIVFLPGVGSDCRVWGDVAKHLQDTYKIYSFSLPPYASENSRGEIFTIHNFHELVDDSLKMLKIKNPILIGYSLGGLVALSYTNHHPRQVKKLILVSSPVKPKHVQLPPHLQTAFEIAKNTKKLQQTIDTQVLTATTRSTVKNILYACFRSKKARKQITTSFQMTKDKGLYNLTTCFEDVFATDIENNIKANIPKTMFIYGKKDPLLKTLHTPETMRKHHEKISVFSLNESHSIPQNKPLETANLIRKFI